MTPTTFKRGDLVRLNSSKMEMTVNFVEGDEVHCMWINNDKNVVYGSFPPAGLVKLAPEDAGRPR